MTHKRTKRFLCLFFCIVILLSLFSTLPSFSATNDKEPIKEQFENFLNEIKLNGELTDIIEYWENNADEGDIDYSELTGENGNIRVGTTIVQPYSYMKDGHYVGVSMDLCFRFCKEYGYTMDVEVFTSINSMVMANSSNKIDIGASDTSITDERKESVDFSSAFTYVRSIVATNMNSDRKVESIDERDDMRIGIVTGTIYHDMAYERNPKAEILEYNNLSDMLIALDSGKVDCIIYDNLPLYVGMKNYSNIKEVQSLTDDEPLGFTFQKDENSTVGKLQEEFDAYLQKALYQGELEKIKEKWVNDVNGEEDLDFSLLTGENGSVKMAIVTGKPFCMPKNNHFVGICVEMAYNFCLEKGYSLETEAYGTTNDSIVAVTQGKCDFANSSISITDERKEIVNFSSPFLKNRAPIVIRTEDADIYKTTDDLANQKIGTITGTIAPDMLKDLIPTADVLEYQTDPDLVKALESKKVDAIVEDEVTLNCALAEIGVETKEIGVLYDNDYYGVVFPKVTNNNGFGGFISSIKESFNKTFIVDQRYKLFIEGILTTLLITISSILIGTIVAFLVYLLIRRGNKVAIAIEGACNWLIKGLPTVVLLMIFYYIVFGKSGLSGVIISIIVFSIVFAAEVVGMLTSSVSAIDNGQFEVSTALGYKDSKAFFKMILPQALRFFWPSYKSAVIAHIKATAIVGYIAVQDITKASDMVRSSTYEAFFPLIVTAIIYFVLAWLLTLIVKAIDIKTDKSEKKTKKFLKGVDLHD